MKRMIKIFAGILIISTAIWGYSNLLEYIYELTFISNVICGILLLSDGLINISERNKIPSFIYQMVLLCTSVVFCTCVVSLFGEHKFNFSGAFFFLHIINPLAFLAIYLTCVELKIENKSDYTKQAFFAPVMIMCYLLFDYIRFIMTGNLVYGLISKERLTLNTAVIIGVGFYLLMVFMSYGLIKLNARMQKKMTRIS